MLAYASIATVVLWLIPGGHYLTLPLMYLNTIVHELCHAFAAVLTGGTAHQIGVFVAGNGVTTTSGGIALVISSAGYLGASVFGAGLIRSGQTAKFAKNMLVTLGALLAFALLVWIRGDIVGLVASVFWIGALFIASRSLKGDTLIFAVQFLGLQQCLHSLQSVFVLMKINAVQGIENDALIASREFPLPPLVYATIWTLISVGLVGLALFRTSSGSSSSRAG
jgi:hypothetical protein